MRSSSNRSTLLNLKKHGRSVSLAVRWSLGNIEGQFGQLKAESRMTNEETEQLKSLAKDSEEFFAEVNFVLDYLNRTKELLESSLVKRAEFDAKVPEDVERVLGFMDIQKAANKLQPHLGVAVKELEHLLKFKLSD